MQGARVGRGMCEGAVFPEGDQAPTRTQRPRFEVSAYASETVVNVAQCPNAGRKRTDLVTVIVPPRTAPFTLASCGRMTMRVDQVRLLVPWRDQRVACTRNNTEVTFVGHNGNISTHPCTDGEEARVPLRVYTGNPEESPTMTIVYE
ncbi:hypothetical protein KIPB_015504 [Kipferlia bialata]|uniref:Uncharacterized protein n=1 Tax=Kipferlia bialata TaxID=797122 RepID=A0A391NUD9_9EUKA|nr:hypothetical protein KIPB_015504 [Kipferlia bialata]|eukprot:g15504.t1